MELHTILKSMPEDLEPLVSDVIRVLESEQRVRTPEAASKLSQNTIESALKFVEARNPFFQLDNEKRAALARQILETILRIAQSERNRIEKRRNRPVVSPSDLANKVKLPSELAETWKHAGIKSLHQLFTPAATSILREKNIPLSKRRELLAAGKFALGSRNLEASQALYNGGITSLSRLARTPKHQIDAIITKARLDQDSREDIFELQRRACVVQHQAQTLSIDRGSVRCNFGPPGAHYGPSIDSGRLDPLPGLRDFLAGLDISQNPFDETTSCGTCSECENTFSQLAYLFDLLDFIFDQWAVTIDELELILLQDIKGLDCETAQTSTVQIRIIIQVLEKLIGGSILRSDSQWQLRYRRAGDSLVQLLSKELQLEPALNDVASLVSDQRFLADQQFQTLIASLSITSPALAELDSVERSVKTILSAQIDSKYPLPQEPGSGADDEQMLSFLLERSRQEQNRQIDKQELDQKLARIMEPTWVDYRGLLIAKTQKSTKELEDILFIHLTASPCQITTPITQLILSLQAIVLAIQTREIIKLQGADRLAPIIGAKDFSGFDGNTWSWLETYARWSAAMYAFLYPENLMSVPTLRETMSPSFRKAVESLSLSVTASDVDTRYAQFQDELQWVGALQPVSAHVIDEKLYVFAASGSVWMNVVDLQRNTSQGWKLVIDNKDDNPIVGVMPYSESDALKFIALFLDSYEYPVYTKIRSEWITLEGKSERGPNVPQFDSSGRIIENDSAIGERYTRLEFRNRRILVRWVVEGDEDSTVRAREMRASLNAKGNWIEESPAGGQSLADLPMADLPPPSIRAGGHDFTIKLVGSHVLVERADGSQGAQLSTGLASLRNAALVSNLDSSESYIVATTNNGVFAFSAIDLEPLELANDWRALSAGLSKMASELANLLENGTSAIPFSVKHVYFEELYLHFPVLAAWALNRSGDFRAAHDWLLQTYNPFSSTPERFPFSRYFSGSLSREDDWFGDALNPHVLGRQRTGVYLRNVVLLMVRNLIGWADHEFTLNNAESLNRAGELYRLAEKILQSPPLRNPCEEGLMLLEFEIGRRYGISANDLFHGLGETAASPTGRETINELLSLVKSKKSLRTITRQGQKKIDNSSNSTKAVKFSESMERRRRLTEAIENLVIGDSLSLDSSAPSFSGNWLANIATGSSRHSILLQIRNHNGWDATLLGRHIEKLMIDVPHSSIAFVQRTQNVSFKGQLVNDEIRGEATYLTNNTKGQLTFKRLRRDEDLNDVDDLGPAPVSVSLCIPPNPLLASFSNHITIGLLSLDKCRMISGELQASTRPLAGALQDSVTTILNLTGTADVTAIAGDPPRYRYGYLLDQARQRASLAKQLGDALVGALRERDQASYDLLLAQNARELTGTTRELKELVRTEARDAKVVADVQLQRAESNQTFWNDRIANNPGGLSQTERDALGLLAASGWLQFSSAMVNFVAALPAAVAAGAGASLSAASAAATLGSGGGAAPISVPAWIVGNMGLIAGAAAGGQQIAGGLQSLGGALGTWGNEQLTRAGFVRRWEEWNLQNTLADFDAQIADLQVTLAQDRVDITDKDLEIAGLQFTHAQRVFEFLQNKTLNKELYEWMVSVLVDEFRSVMQSATAAAQLAQRALEFEWQGPVTIIKGDYWTVDAPSLREDQKGYGLLGAERLLSDLTRLDDFRLSTDKRRFQLSKNISLAQRLPAEFVRFRQTGKIEFDTLIDWFDEDFPGDYLRLIKSVRVSVIALVPPVDGIHATLSNSGASTVMFPDRPPQRALRTFGESIALDGAYNESGLFVLDYNDPMLLPFEGLGVETHWLFELPPAANRFSFDTIADVLFTLEYTALHDDDYAERVRQRLGTSRTANSVLSMRTSFPDQWYHLQNPVDVTQPRVVTLNVPRTFFAPNTENILLKHLTVLLVPAASVTIQGLKSRLPQNGIIIKIEAVSIPVNGSSIDQNNGSMTTMQPGPQGSGNPPFIDPSFDGQNVVPFGNWEVTFAPDLYIRDSNNLRGIDLLEDVVIVPTIEGTISY